MMWKTAVATFFLLIITFSGSACTITSLQPAIASQTPLLTSIPCTGKFIPHMLDHVTTHHGDTVYMFDSNGAGLAVNDLDNDGDMDIVLANLNGRNAIFWNQGQLTFQKEELSHGGSRAVNTVDVDGDGWLDIVFSQHTASPVYWHNVLADARQSVTFKREELPGVYEMAYAMSWGDLDGDGDLDLVTGSYDAGLEKDLGNSFLFGEGAGVFVYWQESGIFTREQLADEAQALAILLLDVNEDGRTDILVGNDFALQDQVWQQTADGWQLAHPFATTSHSTMSFDAGDLNNDGQWELWATDMKPYRDDPATLAAWQPVFDQMMHGEMTDNPQIMANVVQVWGADGRSVNQAPALGLEATGWSWSGKFGDLNNDGFLDAYVVNGMIAAELFSHLPQNELVEENLAFANDGTGHFVPRPEWGLNLTSSGRGMSLADLDNDGDLDIVINNLLSPAQILENQLCGGSSLEVELRWHNSLNTHALGAKVILQTDQGSFTREVRASSGYLSGDAARLHFGLPPNSRVIGLEIIWPDGQISQVRGIKENHLLRVERP